jgi:hypothetical protein
MTHYIFCPRQKILLDFQNQRYIGIFMSLRESREREHGRARERERKREREGTKV